jgi:predicted metal-dependent peptidase
MSYKNEQIEKGALKRMVSREYRKHLKKARRKKIRNVREEEKPNNNQYEGWAI